MSASDPFATLPTDFTADYVYGWKQCHIARRISTVQVGIVGHYGQFSPLDATFRCDRSGHGFDQAGHCTCGHYHTARRPRSELYFDGLLGHQQSGMPLDITIRVAASGIIYEYEGVRRAERQQVTDIWLPAAATCQIDMGEYTMRLPVNRAERRRSNRRPSWKGKVLVWIPRHCGRQLAFAWKRYGSWYPGLEMLTMVCPEHNKLAPTARLSHDDVARITGLTVHTEA